MNATKIISLSILVPQIQVIDKFISGIHPLLFTKLVFSLKLSQLHVSISLNDTFTLLCLFLGLLANARILGKNTLFLFINRYSLRLSLISEILSIGIFFLLLFILELREDRSSDVFFLVHFFHKHFLSVHASNVLLCDLLLFL